jgi:hypothetical protein
MKEYSIRGFEAAPVKDDPLDGKIGKIMTRGPDCSEQ